MTLLTDDPPAPFSDQPGKMKAMVKFFEEIVKKKKKSLCASLTSKHSPDQRENYL